MENTALYRLWQRPFADRKLAPLLRRGELDRARRVLDLGCGPGTNTRYFAHSDYLGIDVNPRYVEYARRRFGREFMVADVTEYRPPEKDRFDFVLINSLLHHVDDDGVRRILSSAASLLTPSGHVHILDLVLAARPGIARTLARWDRGSFARPLARWEELFTERLETVVLEPYPLGVLGTTLWNMVYFKGRSRDRSLSEARDAAPPGLGRGARAT
jgi:SAM-dependent methyltransferase